MGYPMAKCLAKHGHAIPNGAAPLLVFNRTKEKAMKLKSEVGDRIRVADSLEQLALECDVVFTSLATDDAVKSVYNAFHSALKNSTHTQPKIFVETSTCYPTLASELDSLLSPIPHTHFVTGPIFGPPAVAAKGDLVLVLSGDYRSKKIIAYLAVPAMARKVIDLGGNVEKGNPLFPLGILSLLIHLYVSPNFQTHWELAHSRIN